MRLVQTNLRETDVTVDPDRFVESLKEFSANAVLFNAGGIVANYPTELPFHHRNPLLRNDFLGEVIERAHTAGIRLIARFDFSKLNEEIAANHPEWHYKSLAGESVTYNGQVHTCVNGGYQQERSLEILAEVASRYPIDGVFINMHGYQVRDYSRVFHGFCQCDNCARRFGAAGELPRSVEDASYPAYLEFQSRTVAELFERRAVTVKNIRPSIATCNYTPAGTDIFRLESGTHMADGLPDFTYSASHQVKMVTASFPGMAVSNAAVHFVDFPMRHSAVSPHLTALRLAQDMVHGGWLDFYVLGTLDGQEDRRCFDQVRDLYGFHAAHERHYTGTTPVSDVCLVQPRGRGAEFFGVYRILAENHVQFDVISETVADRERLRDYTVVVLPDARMDIDTDRRVLRTGTTGDQHIQGAYFAIRPDDKKTLSGLDDLDLVYLYGAFEPTTSEGESYLAYIPPHMFGPPEKCYYTEVTDTPGMVRTPSGDVEIPWNIGTHYQQYAHDGHARLVMAALRDLLHLEPSLTTDAPPTVEVTLRNQPGTDCRLVHLVNLTGQLGTAFHAPVPVRDITVSVATDRTPLRAHALRAGVDIPLSFHDGTVSLTLPELSLFETVVITYGRNR
ncbi:alpha-amylase family protein [Streptomyces scabiei]|uniref:alpha-amylase family protein n=1 Tax=Streptomyces scabiei TaxID=1930 RepID=UPI00298FA2FD|nr:alpha-amylase family protein [Streptomyces scabiei]